MTTTFENAKVGDRVYWASGPECKVGETNGVITEVSDMAVRVRFENQYSTIRFSVQGIIPEMGTSNQELFWSKPNIVAPEQPKTKGKKVLTGWVNVYRDVSAAIFSSRKEADAWAHTNRIACVEVKGEYEVEE